MNIREKLKNLLEYTFHLAKNQRPTFKIDEYKLLKILESDLSGCIGVQHNLKIHDRAVWLKIDRLKRTNPPQMDKKIEDWLIQSDDLDSQPKKKEKIMQSMSEENIKKRLFHKTLNKDDISDSLQEKNSLKKLKDVTLRLEKLPILAKNIENYLQKDWIPWSIKEKLRRKTIQIYDKLFLYHQSIKTQQVEIELVWGVGMVRWKCESRHEIDYPLIEKQVEIEIDQSSKAILLYPRDALPVLKLEPYIALDNQGVNNLRIFEKEWLEDGLDIEFSPYNNESFASILRRATTYLSEDGVYLPDTNSNKENRSLNKIGSSLEITDTWVIFAKPKSMAGFMKDIKQFQVNLDEQKEIFAPFEKIVTEPSSKKILPGGNITLKNGHTPAPIYVSNISSDLFFPKPFNEAQKQIIEKLEVSDAVIVQGPPGTGKTHTIANIICHYLAIGKTILVTSKNESALSVVQSQIPEELRKLTISYFTNEQKNRKQLESTIQELINITTEIKIEDLKKDEVILKIKVDKLKKDISGVNEQMQELAIKQLKGVSAKLSGMNKEVTAMELAEEVMKTSAEHNWLKDEIDLSDKYNLQFSNSDIMKIRKSRIKLEKDLCYVNKILPSPSDFLNSNAMVEIHEDLIQAKKYKKDPLKEKTPILSAFANNSIDRAKKLICYLEENHKYLVKIDGKKYSHSIFSIDYVELNENSINLIQDVKLELSSVLKTRNFFIKTLIKIPTLSEEKDNVINAVKNLKEGKPPFSLFSFGNKKTKQIIDEIRIDGDKPTKKEEWQLIDDFLVYQDSMRKFIIKWNHIGQELQLPELTFKFGDSFQEIQHLNDVIQTRDELSVKWDETQREISALFPSYQNIKKLVISKYEIEKFIKEAKQNLSQIRLSSQDLKINDIATKLEKTNGVISDNIKDFIRNDVGNLNYSSLYIKQKWQELVEEVKRLQNLMPFMDDIVSITKQIANSGAIKWAESLKTIPCLDSEDKLTPSFWYESWQWRRRYQYLKYINCHGDIKDLSSKCSDLDGDLKKAFLKLISVKTKIGLNANMTDSVKSALVRFKSSAEKIGKGTGKRAPRHKQEANRAIEACYSGIPCWIMSTFQISEILPSQFGSFDLVIIDEASQSDITALPAIMRGKKILIVGDDKQVSPTAAFVKEDRILQLKHNFLKEQPFAELLLPGASIYDLAGAAFPSQRVMLTEHFRCVEPIIQFSMQFYNDQLIPLRIPKESEKFTPPLIDVYVENGTRNKAKNINELEAKAIVEEIKKGINSNLYKKRSIGVISLTGFHQARYIQEKLLNELGKDVYEDYQIACGDAATFQGKEKHIIFLSMVVGDDQGSIMNRKEDEQRMNVALSRAKDRMYLYRSISDSKISSNESDLRRRILSHFSSPMKKNLIAKNQIDLCESSFEEEFYTKLLNKGYKVTPQVSAGGFFIDLVVEGENDQRLAIELDGDAFHPETKWQEDWSRQRISERVGWKFWRCWGSRYYIEPKECMNDLISVLDEMEIKPIKNNEAQLKIYTEKRIWNEKEVMLSNENIVH